MRLAIIILIAMLLYVILIPSKKLLPAFAKSWSNRMIQDNFEYDHKYRIAIVTLETRNLSFTDLHNKTVQNYCDRYGYTYIFKTSYSNKVKLPIYWQKLQLVYELLPKYDYVLWLDSDTFICHPEIPLEYILKKSGSASILIGKDQPWTSSTVYCAGVFLIRNDKIGKKFIEDCINYYIVSPCDGQLKGEYAGECYEQGVMNLLVREKYDVFTFVDTENILFLNQLNKDETVMSNPVFLHLAGFPNKIRNEVFEKLK